MENATHYISARAIQLARGQRLFVFALFLTSSGVVALTGNLVMVSVWTFIWFLAVKYSDGDLATGYFYFFLSFLLFYPVTSSVYTVLNEHGVVLSLILISFALIFFRRIPRELSAHPSARFIFYAWIGWGLLESAIVIFSVLRISFPAQVFGVSPNLAEGSTGLKTIGPVLTSVLALVLPLVGLQNAASLERFWSFIKVATTSLLLLSFTRYFLRIDFVPQEYADILSHGFRMTSFSMPDPNGFGRQLLLPLMFLLAFSISGSKKMSALGWFGLNIAVLGLVLSFSRTSYMSFAAGMITVLALSLNKSKAFLVGVGTLVLASLAIVLFEVISDFPVQDDRLNLNNFSTRVRLFTIALHAVSENPFLGALPGGYQNAMFSAQETILSETGSKYFYAEHFMSTHNYLLQIAVEWGLPMACLLLLSTLWAFRKGLLVRRSLQAKTTTRGSELAAPMSVAVVALSVVYFVHGMTEVVPSYFVYMTVGIAYSLTKIVRTFPS